MNWIGVALLTGGLVVASGGAFAEDFDQFLNSKIAKMEKGKVLTQEDKDETFRQFKAYHAVFTAKYGTDQIVAMSPEDQAQHYVKSVRMAIIDPERHDGWPFLHPGLSNAYKFLKTEVGTNENQNILLAVIFPALYYNNVPLAVSAHKKLVVTSPYLATVVVDYVSKNVTDNPISREFLATVTRASGQTKTSTNGTPNKVPEATARKLAEPQH